jgi:lysophospholipase
MIRGGVLLALLLSLSACGARGERDPFADSRIPSGLGPAFWPPPGWTWGLIQVGRSPPQRYGVAAPQDEPPIAQVLLLPGYGGAAEETFRAANGFLDRRVQVWALDGVGQGGSGRIALPRDLGHVASFQPDILGVQQMVSQVIRPTPDAPLVAVADGTAAPVLLAALQRGLPGVAAIVLTEPGLGDHAPGRLLSPQAVGLACRLGLGRMRAPGAAGWRRQANAAPGSSGFVRQAWQTANPDLRMGGPSLGWVAAFDALQAQVRADGLRKAAAPALVLVDPAELADDRARAAALCRALPRCTLASAGADQWPAREADFIAGAARTASLPNLGRER